MHCFRGVFLRVWGFLFEFCLCVWFVGCLVVWFFLREFLIKHNDNYCDMETLLLKLGLFSLFLPSSLFPLGCTLTGKNTFWSKLPHS